MLHAFHTKINIAQYIIQFARERVHETNSNKILDP